MLITIHLSDGRKITKDTGNIAVFLEGSKPQLDDFKEGRILINQAHIIDMRAANKEEIEHAKIHGW